MEDVALEPAVVTRWVVSRVTWRIRFGAVWSVAHCA